MLKSKKVVKVNFESIRLKRLYESMPKGDALKKKIDNAIKKIKQNPHCGHLIPKKQIPKEYKKKGFETIYHLSLSSSWRLIYSVIGLTEVEILAIILEWFTKHKDYEKRFKYKVR